VSVAKRLHTIFLGVPCGRFEVVALLHHSPEYCSRRWIAKWPMSTDPLQYYVALRKVAAYFGAHPSEDVSLSKAASIAGLERTYFSRFFKQKTGLNFSTWKRQQQVAAAVGLLRESDNPLKQVANLTGFPNVRTLRRAFAVCLGTSPSQVRPFGKHARTNQCLNFSNFRADDDKK
jgi:AraC-like DNA-binding protein